MCKLTTKDINAPVKKCSFYAWNRGCLYYRRNFLFVTLATFFWGDSCAHAQTETTFNALSCYLCSRPQRAQALPFHLRVSPPGSSRSGLSAGHGSPCGNGDPTTSPPRPCAPPEPYRHAGEMPLSWASIALIDSLAQLFEITSPRSQRSTPRAHETEYCYRWLWHYTQYTINWLVVWSSDKDRFYF